MIVTQPKRDYGSFDPMNWVGIIENAHDPLKIGMYKVRIIGMHSPNVEEVPVDNLPWAHAVVPLSQGTTTSIAREGEWVVGYFLDPENLQYPIIVGILPGIQSTNVINITNSQSRKGSGSFDNSAGFVPQLTSEQLAKQPTPLPGVIQREVGQPTTVPLARGVVENSSIALSNSNIEHVCDFKKKLRFDIAKEKMLVYKFVQEVRDQIKSFFAGLATGPLGTAVQVAIRQIKEVLKMIKKAADFVTEVAQAITEFIRYCSQILAYIGSLPAKLANVLKKCVNEFTSALSDALSFGNPLDLSDLSPLGEVKSIVDEASKTAQAVQTAVSATVGIVDEAKSLAYNAKSFGRV